MFAFLRTMFQKGNQPTKISRDSWAGSEGTYVEEYRYGLDAVAMRIGTADVPVFTRYNKKGMLRGCAELYELVSGRVLAQIDVTGEAATPSTVWVRDVGLPAEGRKLLERVFDPHPISYSP